jgi:hypothetical protein
LQQAAPSLQQAALAQQSAPSLQQAAPSLQQAALAQQSAPSLQQAGLQQAAPSLQQAGLQQAAPSLQQADLQQQAVFVSQQLLRDLQQLPVDAHPEATKIIPAISIATANTDMILFMVLPWFWRLWID